MYPFPFIVLTCSITGPDISFALFIFSISSSRLCPSTGPIYLKPNSSNITPGTNIYFILFFVLFIVSTIGAPAGILFKKFFTPSLASKYFLSVRNSPRWRLIAPTLSDIAIWLSFNITSKFLFDLPALFKASKATPPVIEPSPITAAIFSLPPDKSLAQAIPNAMETDVELCPAVKVSYSLSLGFGKPEIPFNCLRVENSSFLPVIILCIYA